MEILAPAGSPEGLVASIKGGCDAVYLGGKSFGARAFSDNFTDQQLEGAVNYAHDQHVKVYVTVNTLIKDSEMDEAVSFVKFLADIGTDAVLVQDLGLLKSIHMIDIKKHASTQMGIHSAAGLEWCAKNGLSRAVLNRELTFDELAQIVPDSPIETEVFVQGALCYCLSGGCLFSSLVGGRSGNRGQCAQPCRKRYTKDGTTGYKLSNADLYGVDWLPKLAKLGVTSAKIEGRMRSQAYAYLASKVYAAANRGDDPVTYADADALLKTVFNRGYSDGYFGGVVSPVQQQFADNRGFFLGQAHFADRRFDTAELKEPVNVKDGLSLYQGDRKVGGFKLSAIGRTASPFALPDGVYDVYRTYDPRLDVIKNLVGEPPRFDGMHSRPAVHTELPAKPRAKIALPEMSFYVNSLRNLSAVLPYADRVYFEQNDALAEAQQLCDRAEVECVTLIPRLTPLDEIRPQGRPLMINTPGQYLPQAGDRVYAGYCMNMFNARLHQPFYQTTLSVELSKDEMHAIADRYAGRLEAMVFGRTELMCTRDPGMTNGFLEDEKGFRFPVYRDQHGLAHILNSSDLMLLPYLRELGSFGIESVGIDLRKRPEALAAAVAKAFGEDDVSAKTSLVEMCGGINYGAYLRGTD